MSEQNQEPVEQKQKKSFGEIFVLVAVPAFLAFLVWLWKHGFK